MGGKIDIDSDGKVRVPDDPIIPYIEGNGVGQDIWEASVRVFNAAIETCYGNKRRVEWLEIFAGERWVRRSSDPLRRRSLKRS